MSETDKTLWSETEQRLSELIDQVKDYLPNESIEAVEHYIHHDEYEMAFEGLFIDLIQCEKLPTDISWRDYLHLGRRLKLDQETVFDANFWPKFDRFIKSMTSSRGGLCDALGG